MRKRIERLKDDNHEREGERGMMKNVVALSPASLKHREGVGRGDRMFQCGGLVLLVVMLYVSMCFDALFLWSAHFSIDTIIPTQTQTEAH